MLEFYHLEQKSPEWFALRLGTCTGSNFSKLVTAKGSVSEQYKKYASQKVAECITGHGQEFSDFATKAMLRGNELEPLAVQVYEETMGYRTREIGMVMTDCGRFAVSPDRYVGRDGLLEIKCPLQDKHMENMLLEEVPDDYKPQIQAQLKITGRKWCDFMSFHPEMYPPVILRMEEDPEFQETLDEAMEAFIYDMDMKIWRLREQGVNFVIRKNLYHNRDSFKQQEAA